MISQIRAKDARSAEVFKSLEATARKHLSPADIKILRYSVRMAVEFRLFLESIERSDFPSAWDNDARYCSYPMGIGVPAYNEVSYVNDSIRAGISDLFRIYEICHVLDESRPCEVTPKDLENFTVFRQTYFAKFSGLLNRRRRFTRRLALLVELGKMQVCFLGLTL